MRRPRLLDLFCGAGGCSMGYHRAGFDCVGVDNRPMPRYPFQFIQADALEYVHEHGHEFDAIHASPPCQRYSITRKIRPQKVHLDLLGPVRKLLVSTGKHWMIENVVAAPFIPGSGLILCGTHFGLKVIRHRFFESSIFLFSGKTCKHPPRGSIGNAGKGCRTSGFYCVAGHMFQVSGARLAMGIDWGITRDELAQAIPPAYTEFVGKQLIEVVRGSN